MSASAESPVVRHFTATGFVVHKGSIALHWHRKVKAWLPPGGHIEPNEDPVQAVTREVLEETGLQVEVINSGAETRLSYPEQVFPPYTIMVEDIHDPVQGFHKHIDMIYFCLPVETEPALPPGWQWVSRDALADGLPLASDSRAEIPPEDVRLLGIRAIDFAEDVSSDRPGEARVRSGRAHVALWRLVYSVGRIDR